jgi:hypothetical protein
MLHFYSNSEHVDNVDSYIYANNSKNRALMLHFYSKLIMLTATSVPTTVKTGHNVAFL